MGFQQQSTVGSTVVSTSGKGNFNFVIRSAGGDGATSNGGTGGGGGAGGNMAYGVIPNTDIGDDDLEIVLAAPGATLSRVRLYGAGEGVGVYSGASASLGTGGVNPGSYYDDDYSWVTESGKGGAGANSSGATAGGGGEGGGYDGAGGGTPADGANASGATGGIEATDAGDGADALTDQVGSNGFEYSGGGSGGWGGATRAGGTGANGDVLLCWGVKPTLTGDLVIGQDLNANVGDDYHFIDKTAGASATSATSDGVSILVLNSADVGDVSSTESSLLTLTESHLGKYFVALETYDGVAYSVYGDIQGPLSLPPLGHNSFSLSLGISL